MPANVAVDADDVAAVIQKVLPRLPLDIMIADFRNERGDQLWFERSQDDCTIWTLAKVV